MDAQAFFHRSVYPDDLRWKRYARANATRASWTPVIMLAHCTSVIFCVDRESFPSTSETHRWCACPAAFPRTPPHIWRPSPHRRSETIIETATNFRVANKPATVLRSEISPSGPHYFAFVLTSQVLPFLLCGPCVKRTSLPKAKHLRN